MEVRANGPSWIEAELSTDADLLERFALHRDEPAFAELVRRHGRLVLGVARPILQHEHDVEEVFQATFLTLVLRARDIRAGSSLGSWLYKVAYRLAMRTARRRRRGEQLPLDDQSAAGEDPLRTIHRRFVQAALHDELSRLPDSYRSVLVLCYLEGRSRREAADELNCSVAAVKARLARAKRMLRGSLSRRGIAFSTAAIAAASSVSAAELPAGALAELVRCAGGSLLSGGAPNPLSLTGVDSVGGGPPNFPPEVIQLAREGAPKLMNTTKAIAAATALSALMIGWSVAAPPRTSASPAPQEALVATTLVMQEADDAAPAEPSAGIDMQHDEIGIPIDGVDLLVQALAGQSGLSGREGRSSELSDERRLQLQLESHRLLKRGELLRAEAATNASERRKARARAIKHWLEAERLEQAARERSPREQASQEEEASSMSGLVVPATKPEASRMGIWIDGPVAGRPHQSYDLMLGGYRGHMPASVPCCRGANLAYGRATTASSQEEIINNFAAMAVDGDLTTRWCAEDEAAGQWLQIDLGKTRHVKAIRIHWEMMDTRYAHRVEASSDGKTWRQLAKHSEKGKPGHMTEHHVDAPDTRYLRITFDGNDQGYWSSIREVEVSDDQLPPPPVDAWKKIEQDASPNSFGLMIFGSSA